MQRYKKIISNDKIIDLYKRLFIVTLLVLAANTAWAQRQSVLIDDNKISIEQAFLKIEKQTGFMFVIDKTGFDVTKRVALPKNRASLEEMLDYLMKDTGYGYKFYNKNIIIVKNSTPQSVEVAVEKAVVTQTVTGVVVDDQTSHPIMGAKVTVSGIVGKSAQTDHAGRFSLEGIPVGTRHIRTYRDGYYLSERGMEISEHRDNEISIPLKTTSVNLGSIRSNADKGGIVTAETSGNLATDSIYNSARQNQIATQIPIVETSQSLIVSRYLNGIERHDTKIGIKSNLLYWATLSPNIGLEWKMAPKWTTELTVGVNAWDIQNDMKYRHWAAKPEVRYWFCRPFDGHFIGLHGVVGEFEVMNMPFNRMFPLGFSKELDRDSAYRGWGYGGGLTYGYQWAVGKHWNLEGSIGVGYMRFEYDRYSLYDDCQSCHGRDPRNYFGVTKAGISLIYIIK